MWKETRGILLQRRGVALTTENEPVDKLSQPYNQSEQSRWGPHPPPVAGVAYGGGRDPQPRQWRKGQNRRLLNRVLEPLMSEEK